MPDEPIEAVLPDQDLLDKEEAVRKLEKQFDVLQSEKHLEARRIEAIYRADTLRRMIRERGEEPCA